MRCLCCNRLMVNPSEYEVASGWHKKCIKDFFGTDELPDFNISEEMLENLANSTVNKGLTVPGVQKKLSLHLSKEDKSARFTIVDYPTGYILKPQSDDFRALPESEFLSMKLAEMMNIKTVPNGLIKLNGAYAYITKRIDRLNNRMYAMEDFCQLSNRNTADKYKGSYEGCGRVIDKYSKNFGLDKAEFFYRLIFCFVTGNSDMHLKNFSLIENEPGGRVFSLSPAYDMLPVNIIMPQDKEQMALTVNGKKRNIRKKDFLIMADNLSIKSKAAERIINQVCKYQDKIIEEIQQSYIPDDLKEDFALLVKARVSVFD